VQDPPAKRVELTSLPLSCVMFSTSPRLAYTVASQAPQSDARVPLTRWSLASPVSVFSMITKAPPTTPPHGAVSLYSLAPDSVVTDGAMGGGNGSVGLAQASAMATRADRRATANRRRGIVQTS
jgi:hypothetical protein